MSIGQFEGRKREHLQHALNPAHQAIGLTGLDRVQLAHEALPDLDFQEVKIESRCLGRPSPTPFYIAGMTAGHAEAPKLNRVLAYACAERGWAMGVGSQRRELPEFSTSSESPDLWAGLRKDVPKLVMFANIGVSQLIRSPLASVRRLVDSLQAQALVVHANALQEALQPEGTPQFKGALPALRKVCAEIGVPVVLKETGCGFSAATLRRLAGIGLAAIDVSGLGGTHWGRIEGARAGDGSLQGTASETFAEWGESTVDSVVAARRELNGADTEIWASGGVRTGLDAAKLIALGAHQVGFAKPALEAALVGGDKLRQWMATREYELRVALFCTGSESPAALRADPAKCRQPEGGWKPNAT
jgi:isopentenyl-diphosphate delta-isomerase